MNNLIKRQAEYIELLDKCYSVNHSVAWIHGFRDKEEDIREGERLRAAIEKLNTELTS